MFAPRVGSQNGSISSSKAVRKPKAKANAVAPADAPDETGARNHIINRPASADLRDSPRFGGLLKRRAWTAAERFDMCVFMGDLNYRVEGTRAVDVLLENDMMDVMLSNDQLGLKKPPGAFSGWSEAESEISRRHTSRIVVLQMSTTPQLSSEFLRGPIALPLE